MKINNPYALNEIGQRQNQEDTIFPQKGKANEQSRIFVVCDGMGGHSHGEVASAAVCESFVAALANSGPDDFDETVFQQALDAAYDALDAKDTSEFGSRMGTTLTFLHLNDREAFLAHIGDSRIYHLRTAGGKVEIVHKTSDHSLVGELLRAGVITPEEAKNHPKKNVITRAMQPHGERCKASIHRTADVRAGDWFFLCSDGVLESLSDEKLLEIIAADNDAESKMQAIFELCNAHSRDNFSAWLVPIAKGIAQEERAATPVAEPAATTDPPVLPVPPEEKSTPPAPIRKSGRMWLWVIVFAIVIGLVVCYMVCRKTAEIPPDESPRTEQPAPDRPIREPMPTLTPNEASAEQPTEPAVEDTVKNRARAHQLEEARNNLSGKEENAEQYAVDTLPSSEISIPASDEE